MNLILQSGSSDSNTQQPLGSLGKRMPYRILCNDVQREGVKARPDLASGFFYYVLLHKIRYGTLFNVVEVKIVFEDHESTDDPQVVLITISDDPESMAEAFFQQNAPPQKFLDEIDISNEQGIGELIAYLLLRQRQASLEKDEILRFVKRNERVLRTGALEFLFTTLIDAAEKVEVEEGKGGKKISIFLKYFVTQVQHALDGNPDKMDIISDRLLWLLAALSMSVSNGSISYADGLKILNKKEHKDRMSHSSIDYLFNDFKETIGSLSQPSTEYVMFIAECALIKEDILGAATGLFLLSYIAPLDETDPWLDLISRLSTFLEKNDKLFGRGKEFTQRVFSRYHQEVSEDDF